MNLDNNYKKWKFLNNKIFPPHCNQRSLKLLTLTNLTIGLKKSLKRIRDVIESEALAEMEEVTGKIRRGAQVEGDIINDQEAMNAEAANQVIIQGIVTLKSIGDIVKGVNHQNLNLRPHPTHHQVLRHLQIVDPTLRIVRIIEIIKVGETITKSKTNLQLQTFTHIFRRIRSMVVLKSQQPHKSFGMASSG